MNKIITLIAALFIFVNSSFAATTVSGQIRTNTTWTKAGSPYNCSGKIEVDTNVTLTIEPGAIIDIDKDLVVYGHIVFQNNSTDTTIFKSAVLPETPVIKIPNTGFADTLVLKHCTFTNVRFVVDRKSTLTIQECNFYHSNVNWRPAALTFSNWPTLIFEKNKCIETALGMSDYTADSISIDNNFFDVSIFKSCCSK